MNWIAGWKKRHGIKFYKTCGEAGAVNEDVIDTWLQDVWPGIREGYSDEEIYNADESGLFFKVLPDRTLNHKGRRCTGGKLSKERVTILLRTNATGTHKVKPLVIGRSENPRCFRGVRKSLLPVSFHHNKNSWMTRVVS